MEINDIINGVKIIHIPSMCKPKYGPKNAISPPFKARAAIPKVQTKKGINNFVRSGHNIALIIEMKNMNMITLFKLVNLKSNPKLIKYNPIKFAMNSIKYLLSDSPGVFLSSSISLIF